MTAVTSRTASARNRIAVAALALAAAGFVAPAVTAAVDTAPSTTVHAKSGAGCPSYYCGSGNHNEVLTRSVR